MRERGAALTETVVLIPVLLLGWAGVDYFRAGYTRRMQALSLASHGAWRRSFDPGCAAGASSTQPRAFADLLEPAAGGEFAPLVREAIERYYVGHETLFGLAHVDARVSLGTGCSCRATSRAARAATCSRRSAISCSTG